MINGTYVQELISNDFLNGMERWMVIFSYIVIVVEVYHRPECIADIKLYDMEGIPLLFITWIA